MRVMCSGTFWRKVTHCSWSVQVKKSDSLQLISAGEEKWLICLVIAAGQCRWRKETHCSWSVQVKKRNSLQLVNAGEEEEIIAAGQYRWRKVTHWSLVIAADQCRWRKVTHWTSHCSRSVQVKKSDSLDRSLLLVSVGAERWLINQQFSRSAGQYMRSEWIFTRYCILLQCVSDA